MKRSLEQERTDLLSRLCAMKSQCIICQVLGFSPCGSKSLFQCSAAILGYKSKYQHEQQPLRIVYDSQFKPSLRNFSHACKVCWICYFPYSYKTHARDDDVCSSQKDILTPIAWALFCLPIVLASDEALALQAKVLAEAGVTTPIFDTVQGYAIWLAKEHHTIPNTSNLVELCLAFAKLIIDKAWP